jgi:gliding motility-associated-like protein
VADTIICPGQGFYALSPYPQYDNLWQPDNIQSDSLLINQAGEYTLTTTAPHCTFNTIYKVTSVEEGLSIAQGDTNICTQRPLNLHAELKNISNMQWNTGSKEPGIIVNESGQYIASANGICGPLADTVNITAGDCSCLHFVPNAFTPNKDGLNDKLFTYLHCEPRQYRFNVYNRWGKLVWHTDDVNKHWDGTQDGKPADMGVYFYYMEYRDPLNEKQSHKGEVHLLR